MNRIKRIHWNRLMNEINDKILVVEDTFLIAMQLQMDLKSLGHQVAGPAPSVDRAFKLLDREPIKAALLDIHLGNENSIPIANRLRELKIPFLFITGFEQVDIESNEFDDHVLLRKPINLDQLSDAMGTLLE